MKTKKANLYLGQAGQMLVMAEFLARGWNVAVPQVDVGEDVLVLSDKDGTVIRIQVKTATGKAKKYGCSVQYNVRLSQLITNPNAPLYYVFVTRFQESWQPMLLINQLVLQNVYQVHNIGTIQNDQLLLYFRFQEAGKVMCSQQDFSSYINDWSDFPYLQH